MSKIKPRIGLFGGSFNPIHQGHLNVINHAIDTLKLDEMILIPCYVSVDKTHEPIVSPLHRIAIILRSIPRKCSVSTFELDKKRPIQSIVTLKHFRDVYGNDAELFFIMGSDSFSTIDTWHNYKEFDKYVNLIVYRRKGNDENRDCKGLRVKWIDNDLWDYSSTGIRKGIMFGVSLSAEIYIREHKLYGYLG